MIAIIILNIIVILFIISITIILSGKNNKNINYNLGENHIDEVKKLVDESIENEEII